MIRVNRAVSEVGSLLATCGLTVPDRPGMRLRTLADVFACAQAEGVVLLLDATEVQDCRPTPHRGAGSGLRLRQEETEHDEGHRRRRREYVGQDEHSCNAAQFFLRDLSAHLDSKKFPRGLQSLYHEINLLEALLEAYLRIDAKVLLPPGGETHCPHPGFFRLCCAADTGGSVTTGDHRLRGITREALVQKQAPNQFFSGVPVGARLIQVVSEGAVGILKRRWRCLRRTSWRCPSRAMVWRNFRSQLRSRPSPRPPMQPSAPARYWTACPPAGCGPPPAPGSGTLPPSSAESKRPVSGICESA